MLAFFNTVYSTTDSFQACANQTCLPGPTYGWVVGAVVRVVVVRRIVGDGVVMVVVVVGRLAGVVRLVVVVVVGSIESMSK